MDMKTILTLPAKLTDDEVNAYAREAAEKCLQVNDLEEQKAAHAKHIKGRIDGINADISDLARRVKRREEAREVECHWIYRWISGVKELTRTDTWEVVETRPIEAHERQQGLDIPSEASPEAPPEAVQEAEWVPAPGEEVTVREDSLVLPDTEVSWDAVGKCCGVVVEVYKNGMVMVDLPLKDGARGDFEVRRSYLLEPVAKAAA